MAPAFGHGRAAAPPPCSLTGRSIRRAWLCRSGYGAACTTPRAQGRGLGAPRRGAFALRPYPSSARRRAPIRHAHRRRHCRAPAPATASFCRLPGGRSMDRTELACLPCFRRANCDPYRPYLIATSPSPCAGIRGRNTWRTAGSFGTGRDRRPSFTMRPAGRQCGGSQFRLGSRGRHGFARGRPIGEPSTLRITFRGHALRRRVARRGTVRAALEFSGGPWGGRPSRGAASSQRMMVRTEYRLAG